MAHTLIDTLTDTLNDTLALRKGRSLPFLNNPSSAQRAFRVPQVFTFAFAAVPDACLTVHTTAITAITAATIATATALAACPPAPPRHPHALGMVQDSRALQGETDATNRARLCHHRRKAALTTARRDARATRFPPYRTAPFASSPRRSSRAMRWSLLLTSAVPEAQVLATLLPC